MNQKILEVINSFPTDGTHAYFWPKKEDIALDPSLKYYSGVTKDLIWKGTTIAKAESQRRTYCCGFVFEAWFDYVVKNNLHTSLTDLEMKRIRAGFFINDPKDRTGVQGALVSRGLGTRVELKGAMPGDLMQIWRASGSGHTTFYMGRDANNLIYKSTQGATNGIGQRSEPFGGRNPLTEIHLVRAL